MKRPTGQPAQLNTPLTPTGEYESVNVTSEAQVWVESVNAQVDPWGSESDLWRRQEDEAELPEFELEELTPSLVPIRFAHNRLSEIPQLDDVSLVTSSLVTGSRVSSPQSWAGDELDGAEVFHRIREHLSLPPSAQPSTLKPQGVFEVSAPPEGQWYGEEDTERSLSQMQSTRPAQAVAPRPTAPSTRPARPTSPRPASLSLRPSAILNQERLQLEHDREHARRRAQERLEQERLEQERLEQERLEQEQREVERLDRELLEAERLEAELLEFKRVEAERVEAERVEAERVEAERVEAELRMREMTRQREADELEAELLSLMSAEEVITFTFGLHSDALAEPHRELQSLPPVSSRLLEALTPESVAPRPEIPVQTQEVTELGEDDETLPPASVRPERSQSDERADLFHTERRQARVYQSHPPTLRLRPLRQGGLKQSDAQFSQCACSRVLPLLRSDELHELLNLRPLRPLYEPIPLEGAHMPRRHVASLYEGDGR